MGEKKVFYSELSYVLGIFILATGCSFMERANFGLSMVVAPAYLLHLKISQFLPFFSFGMAGYVFQAFLLCALAIITRKLKKSYFLSFVTAFIYGLVLDAVMSVVALFCFEGIVWRVVIYITGLLFSSTGVALLFHTYLPPEAYELFVKELSCRLNISIGRMKTVYDCCSCVLAVVLSICFFGVLVGVSWGTVVCAMLNGFFIGRISKFLEKNFTFKDALSWREKIN